jgi:hypothetical protein
MTGSDPFLSEHDFLDANMCDSVVQCLGRHPEAGFDRNPARPGTFVTYGRAAYLDVCLQGADADRDYYARLPDSNRTLQSLFGDLLNRLRVELGHILGDPVAYLPEQLALPGIHIFRGPGIRSAGEAGAHFDVQYQRLHFGSMVDRSVSPISFTALLEGPACGTGLQVHNVSYQDYERAYLMGRIVSLQQLVERRTSAYFPYSLGRLVVHRKLFVHCIATPGPVSADDQRITLQGHAIRSRGTWILYW